MQSRWRGRKALIVGAAVAMVGGLTAMVAGPALGDSPEEGQPPAITVAEMVAHSPAGGSVASVHRMAELFRKPEAPATASPPVVHGSRSGGAVVVGAPNAEGFNGLAPTIGWSRLTKVRPGVL